MKIIYSDISKNFSLHLFKGEKCYELNAFIIFSSLKCEKYSYIQVKMLYSSCLKALKKSMGPQKFLVDFFFITKVKISQQINRDFEFEN